MTVQSFYDFCLPIYLEWDRLQVKPPEGFVSWMDYRESMRRHVTD